MLPTCPSCSQSVLDDDATECPFCGASMKGKPGAKPSSSSAAKPVAKKAAAPKKAETPEEADPFGVTSTFSARKAIQLLPKPGKGKLFRVLCPMCETPGFWSKDCIGKEVRCASEKCLMPLFTAVDPDAPPVEKPSAAAPLTGRTAEPASAPKKKIPPVVLVSGVVVLVGGGILGAAIYMSGQSAKTKESLDKPYVPPVVASSDPDPATDPNPAVEPSKAPVVKVGPTSEELRADGFKRMLEYTLDPEKNPQKPYCRRMMAEALALAGKLKEVPEQLSQLEKVGGAQLKYFGLLPVLNVGWKHFEAGRMAEAKAAVTEAQALFSQAPAEGAMPLEAAIELAALLVVLDRSDDAKSFLQGRSGNAPELEQLVETSLRAEALKTFHFDQIASLRAASLSNSPWVATTFILSARGQAEKALAWARSAPTPVAVAECLSAWAESRVWSGSDLGLITKEIEGLAPARKANVLARLAVLHHALKKDDLAKAEIEQALAAVTAMTAPPSKATPNLLGVYNLKLEDISGIVGDANAVAEVARTQVAMGQKADGWKTFQKALDFARATAPAPGLAEQPLNLIKQSGDIALQNDLKSALKLKTKDEAEIAFRQYRKNALALAETANVRMSLEVALLESACDAGLFDEVWEEIKTRTNSTDAASREPWFDTRVPVIVQLHFKATSQTDKAAALEQAVTTEKLSANPAHRTAFRLESERLLATEPARVPAVLKQYTNLGKAAGDTPWMQDLSMSFVTRLVAQGKTTDAFAFARAIDDPVFRNTILELVASQATRRKEQIAVRDFANGKGLTPPERVAVLRGLLANLP